MINPTIVEGQVMGGLAQGIAGTLYEKIEIDEDGNITNANFVDFLVPYATEIPPVEIYHLETPSPLNPLGVKGVGEAGCIAVGATIASGLADALEKFNKPKFLSLPITPSMIFDVISDEAKN
jgi:CO/xanthine dehydrogenase Mo-binding subunit